METTSSPTRHVALALEMEWGHKRHVEVFAGCQKYADEAGWNCRIYPAIDQTLASGKGPHFDGVIARVTPAIAEIAQKTKTPLVNVWLNSPVKDLPGVFPDYKLAGKMGAEHLLSRGFTNFGFLGSRNDLDTKQQHSGFSKVIEASGYTCTLRRYARTRLIGAAPGWEEYVDDIEQWMESWKLPIGIMVNSDLHARYLVDICRSKKLKISEDLAVIGTSNEVPICESPSPTLTSVDLGFAQIGYQAAATLDRLMNGTPLVSDVQLIPPTELAPRQSTDLYACNDITVSYALSFISENSHRNITVPDVVHAVATNRRGLERKFRDSLGKSISREITRLRIERAKRQLAETNSTIKEVAASAGFRNADHFYKVFLRVEGEPPSRYREKHQQLFAFDDDTLTP